MKPARALPRFSSSVLSIVMVLALALGVGAALLVVYGQNPAQAYAAIATGAFGSGLRLGATIALTSVLVLTGLCAAISFRGNVWNIGGEGQLYMGAVGAAIVALSSVPPWALLPFALGGGFLFGAAWGLVAAGFKAVFKVDEIVSTILMNFVALFFLDFLVSGPLRDFSQSNNQSAPFPLEARLPLLVAGTQLNVSILISIPLALIAYFMLFRTRLGFEIRLVGGNPSAARYAGIGLSRTILALMTISGGLAGVAGAFLVTGTTFLLIGGLSRIYGYVGIGIAALSGLNPLSVIPTALFFAALDVGGTFMQIQTGIPIDFVQVITATIVVAVTLRLLLTRRWGVS